MAKKSPKRWVYSPKTGPKPKIPEALKQQVTTRYNALVDSLFKPEHILPPPEDAQFSYIVDLSTSWYHSFLYFCATYRCPAPECVSESFEVKFTRLEYAGADRFHLAYMRHTEQWQVVLMDLSLDECLDAIDNMPIFWP